MKFSGLSLIETKPLRGNNEVEKGSIKLNIDKVFSLNQVAEAHQYMEDNKAKGKLVVKI